MTSMLDATRRTHPHLLTPRAMCEHCGVRRVHVGVLCCTCEEDPEEKAAFLARQAEMEEDDEPRACRWGGCNGTGPRGGHCNRCGSPVI